MDEAELGQSEPSGERLRSVHGGTGPDPATDAGITMSLRRLLAIATLTPEQAALLARDLVEEVDALLARGQPPTVVSDRSIQVTVAGELRLAHPAAHGELELGGRGEGSTEQDDAEHWHHALRDATAVIRQLAVNAWRRSRRERDEPLPLDPGFGDAEEGPAAVLERARTAAGRILGDDEADRSRVRRELAVLVTAASGGPRAPPQVAEPGSRRHWAPPPVPVAPVLAAKEWRGLRGKGWHRRSVGRFARAAAVAFVVVALVAAGWRLLPWVWSEAERRWTDFFSSEEPTQHFAPVGLRAVEEVEIAPQDQPNVGEVPPVRSPAPVALPAPPLAGPITEVALLEAEGPCVPGEVCRLRVEVALERAGVPRAVEWSFHVVDRCMGLAETAPGVRVTAQPGWGRVFGISRPELAPGNALAVIAVTSAPDRAASPALLLPPDAESC